jgi:hypothetical protein
VKDEGIFKNLMVHEDVEMMGRSNKSLNDKQSDYC